ncbi:hypothetical protein AJ80_04746 [Polytolypa hystricis UAMH7299]|uniref:Uncharacterized protein n=1 Tax=Polytolypa hystricis (strain UAMH7299) TaxID=1447883 RepID=A0A2B7Y9H5_POLH7|nr:hypothetical protein AJ80_04746 [Polytolypa hystricis UAMH7299]
METSQVHKAGIDVRIATVTHAREIEEDMSSERTSMLARFLLPGNASSAPYYASDSTVTDKMNIVRTQRRRARVWWSHILLPCTVLAPLGILIWWIVDMARKRPSIIEASTIGGQLTNLEAKAIDFVCGAILSPLLMVLLDYLWFSSARVSVVNERPGSKAVPLASLVAASQSSQGSFNLFKIYTIFRGRTWRLALLGWLLLFSGMASRMLQNFIAYEAFDINVPGNQPVPLRYMSDAYIDSPQFNMLAIGGSASLSQAPLSVPQRSTIANQMSALLTGLNFESAASKLDKGAAYIGTNATIASLNALNSSIVSLTNVPGYRLSVECQPSEPTTLSALQMGETYFQLGLIFNCPTTPSLTCGANYAALIPGMMTIGSSQARNNEYQYIALLSNNTYAHLGYLDSFNQTNTTFTSEYGDIRGKAFNMTPSGFESTKSIMTTWGINCAIMRQEGFHNYTRQSDGTRGWKIDASSFSDEKKVVPSFLGPWQTALKYQAPISAISGIGPPIATTAGSAVQRSANWTLYALNYLYASAEAQRISYEVFALNDTSPAAAAANKSNNVTTSSSIAAREDSSPLSDYFYTVDATVAVQFYRITYIPLILMLGLISVIVAAAITAGMTLYSKDTRSGRFGREVDGVRLVVDSVAGLRDSASSMAAAGKLSTRELDDWAAKFQVRYSEVMDGRSRAGAGGGDVAIRLFRSGDEKLRE